MTATLSPLVEMAARLLGPEEREAVLGDLAEAREGAWRSLCSVAGLVVRRQAMLWKSWRPWLAGFAIALPSSFLLMGVSLSVSWSYQRLLCPELLRAASLTRAEALTNGRASFAPTRSCMKTTGPRRRLRMRAKRWRRTQRRWRT